MKERGRKGGDGGVWGTQGQNGNALRKKSGIKKGLGEKGRVILALKVNGVNMR